MIKAGAQAGDDAQFLFRFVENGFVNLGSFRVRHVSESNDVLTAVGTLSLSMTSRPSAPLTFFKIPKIGE